MRSFTFGPCGTRTGPFSSDFAADCDLHSGRWTVKRFVSMTLVAVVLADAAGAPPALAAGTGFGCPLFGGNRDWEPNRTPIFRGAGTWRYPSFWLPGPGWPPGHYPPPMGGVRPPDWNGMVRPNDEELAADRGAMRTPGVAQAATRTERQANGDSASVQPELISGYRFRPLDR